MLDDTTTGKASLAETFFQKLFGERRAVNSYVFSVQNRKCGHFSEIRRFWPKTRKSGSTKEFKGAPIDHFIRDPVSKCPRAVRGSFFRDLKIRVEFPRKRSFFYEKKKVRFFFVIRDRNVATFCRKCRVSQNLISESNILRYTGHGRTYGPQGHLFWPESRKTGKTAVLRHFSAF
jgi:hypothetical protein